MHPVLDLSHKRFTCRGIECCRDFNRDDAPVPSHGLEYTCKPALAYKHALRVTRREACRDSLSIVHRHLMMGRHILPGPGQQVLDRQAGPFAFWRGTENLVSRPHLLVHSITADRHAMICARVASQGAVEFARVNSD